MSSTLAEQLRTLPLVSTVLRVDFDLLDNGPSFNAAVSLLLEWADTKCAKFGVRCDWNRAFDSIRADKFTLEHARTDDGFAYLLSHPDSKEDRDWIAEVSLDRTRGEDRSRFSTRLSIRQSRDSHQPLPRAPKYLGELVRRVGGTDVSILESEAATFYASGFDTFNDLLISKRRTLPILAISQDQFSGEIEVDSAELASHLCGIAHVAVIHPQVGWALTEIYGQERSAFNGAIRCYLPGFGPEDDPYKHKLWLREGIRRADALNPKGFLNSCLRHIFAVTTAEFEPYPLLTPATLKRQTQPGGLAVTTATIVIPAVLDQAVGIVGPDQPAAEEAAAEVEEPTEAAAPESIPIVDESAVEMFEATVARLEESEKEVIRLEKLLQEARDETAQKNRTLTELQPFKQEVEDLRDEIKLLRGEYERKDAPVLVDFWDGFNLFFSSARNLADQFERVQRQLREEERAGEERDQYKEELDGLKGKVFHLEQRVLELQNQERPKECFALFPESWEEFVAAEKERMNFLWFFRDVPDQLLACPYDATVAKEVNDVLAVLNALASETSAAGALTERGTQLYQDYFLKVNAWFSDESETNKAKFESKLSFPDPEGITHRIFCPWHGKINKQQFRVHFEWPRPTGQRKIKVTYIGPKITKQ